jgi:hypothetical protein
MPAVAPGVQIRVWRCLNEGEKPRLRISSGAGASDRDKGQGGILRERRRTVTLSWFEYRRKFLVGTRRDRGRGIAIQFVKLRVAAGLGASTLVAPAGRSAAEVVSAADQGCPDAELVRPVSPLGACGTRTVLLQAQGNHGPP